MTPPSICPYDSSAYTEIKVRNNVPENIINRQLRVYGD